MFLNKTPDLIASCCEPAVLGNTNSNISQHSRGETCCDPVVIGNNTSSTLMWCDDLVVFSQSATGLQNAITKTNHHFSSLGLQVNKTKT